MTSYAAGLGGGINPITKDMLNNFYIYLISAFIAIAVGGLNLSRYRDIVFKKIKEYFPEDPLLTFVVNPGRETQGLLITKFEPKYSEYPELKPILRYLNRYELLFTVSILVFIVVFVGIYIVEMLRTMGILISGIRLEKLLINGISFFYLTLGFLFILYRLVLNQKN